MAAKAKKTVKKAVKDTSKAKKPVKKQAKSTSNVKKKPVSKLKAPQKGKAPAKKDAVNKKTPTKPKAPQKGKAVAKLKAPQKGKASSVKDKPHVTKTVVKSVVAEKKPIPQQEKVKSAPLIMAKKNVVKPKDMIIVYGMIVDAKKVANTAIEAYNKKRFTVHDLKLSEYGIGDLKFNNLMVKIALLDRIQEEILRHYSHVVVNRPNTVTLSVEN